MWLQLLKNASRKVRTIEMLSDECKWDSTSMHKLYPPKPLHTHLQNLVSMNNPASACKDVFFFFLSGCLKQLSLAKPNCPDWEIPPNHSHFFLQLQFDEVVDSKTFNNSKLYLWKWWRQSSFFFVKNVLKNASKGLQARMFPIMNIMLYLIVC